MSLVLASGSRTRARMLRAAGVEIEVSPARVDEDEMKAALKAEGAQAREIADALAELKARRVSGRFPGRLVLGADQVLVCDGEVFDKPADRAAARAQLLALRGRVHQLMSSGVVFVDGEPVWRHIGTARMTMRPFSEAFVDDYLDRVGEAVCETVGAYHLEGLGAQLFSRVDGDHFAVLGLPLLELLGFLRARRLLIE